jgi:hypothetical protein
VHSASFTLLHPDDVRSAYNCVMDDMYITWISSVLQPPPERWRSTKHRQWFGRVSANRYCSIIHLFTIHEFLFRRIWPSGMVPIRINLEAWILWTVGRIACTGDLLKAATYTWQHTHRINAGICPCLEWDLNPRFHCSRRYFVPYIVRPLWWAY